MELTTKVLAVKDWTKSVNVRVILGEKEVWLKYNHAKQDGTMKSTETSDIMNAMKPGDTAQFAFIEWKNPNTGAISYFINDVLPEEDVHADTHADANPMQGFDKMSPEEEASLLASEAEEKRIEKVLDKKVAVVKQAESNSYNTCNAMNASANLMNVIIEVYGAEMKPDELFKMHQDILSGGVMKGARLLVEDYY